MKIVVGGQMDKDNVAAILRKHLNPDVEIKIMSDIEASMAIKTGTADYYFGACNTGGGGALAMAIALLGINQCSTVAMPGNIRSKDEIIKDVESGKKAFGFTPQAAEIVIPIIVEHIKNKSL
jgi:hypothetical protein